MVFKWIKTIVVCSTAFVLVGGTAATATIATVKINENNNKIEGTNKPSLPPTSNSNPDISTSPNHPIEPKPDQNPDTGTINPPNPAPHPDPEPGPITPPKPTPQEPTITEVVIDNSYDEYYVGDQIQIQAFVSPAEGIDSSLVKYEWHIVKNGKDSIDNSQTTFEFLRDATLEDNGLEVYVKVSYKTTTLTSTRITLKVVEDPDGGGEVSPQPLPQPQPVPPPSVQVSPLDSAPIVNLPTPEGYKSWKGKLKQVNPNGLISETQMNEYLAKMTFAQMEEEFVAQARFVFYQTFEDNFTEINYYSKPLNGGQEYECIIEGIVKDTVNNKKFFLQNVGTSQQSMYSVQAGQKIKLTYIPRQSSFLPPLSAGTFPWSFARNTDLIDRTSKTQYCTNLAGYSAKFEINGSIYKQYSYDVLRGFSFVIARLKTALV